MMPASKENQPSLWAKLERFEEPFAVLTADNMGAALELRWPLGLLPANAKIGDMLIVKLNTKENEEELIDSKQSIEELTDRN
mgnify:CR=1 FL=1